MIVALHDGFLICPQYDVTPLEFGAWTGVKAFSPIKYLGTTFVDGKPKNTSACVRGFDRARRVDHPSKSGTNAERLN